MIGKNSTIPQSLSQSLHELIRHNFMILPSEYIVKYDIFIGDIYPSTKSFECIKLMGNYDAMNETRHRLLRSTFTAKEHEGIKFKEHELNQHSFLLEQLKVDIIQRLEQWK